MLAGTVPVPCSSGKHTALERCRLNQRRIESDITPKKRGSEGQIVQSQFLDRLRHALGGGS